MFEKLKKFIDNNALSNEEGRKLVKINTLQGSATYYDEDAFRNNYMEYMIGKYKHNDVLTDNYNYMNAIAAINTVYLDGDFTFKENVEESLYNSTCIELAKEYTNEWLEQLNGLAGDFYYFMFIPNSFKDNKGGFHVMIFCEEDVTKDDRLSIYNYIKNSFEDKVNNKYENLINYDSYEHLFDVQPIKSMTTLLPFAKKRGGRNYTLHESTFNWDKGHSYFISAIDHASYEQTFSSETKHKGNINNLHDDIDIDEQEKLNKEFAHLQDMQVEAWKFGTTNSLVAEFMSSLLYLSPDHIFWQKLKNNDERLKLIVTPLIKFMTYNFVIEFPGQIPDTDEFITLITKILLPLLQYTVKPHEKTNRATFSSCASHVKSYYIKYSHIDGLYDKDLMNFINNYYNIYSAKDKKKLCNEDIRYLNKFKNICSSFVSSWVDFIVKIILNGLTDEIQPFDKNSRSKSIYFDDVINEQANVNNLITIEDSFYIKTMRLWCMMFLFVEYYNTNSINESIRGIITAFMRYYIWSEPTSIGEPNVYIYNIHQTRELKIFPYNQWIQDNTKDHEFIQAWVKHIYTQFIKEELQTTNRIVRFQKFIDNLAKGFMPIIDKDAKSVRTLANFHKDIKTIFKNVMSSFTQERYSPPRILNITTEPFLPMRNGILEFKNDGTIQFHIDNHDKLMNGYTNIVWVEDYDYNCSAYKAVKTMIEQIYPHKDERDYMLTMFSSTLHGYGLRDQLIIMYGTGGDGKTTMSRAIESMLGGDGVSQHVPLIENGKTVYIQNPHGLSSSMKTDTILVANKSSHDEGGLIQLKDKRYCSVQEPDERVSSGKLNCAVIKEILSATTINARHIHKGSEPFVPNVLLTLQTNSLLSYTEDNDAMRRRLSVVPHRSKFNVKALSNRTSTMQYNYQADPKLNYEISNNPLYWQALFYILLPYAQNLIKYNMLPLSNITKPNDVMKALNDSFIMSNGIIGWLNANIEQCDGGLINISILTTAIINYDNANKSTFGKMLTGNNLTEVCKEIHKQLFSTYVGSIYKLNEKYVKEANDLKLEYQEGISNSELIKEYFSNYAVQNITTTSSYSDKKDMYIVGYKTSVKLT